MPTYEYACKDCNSTFEIFQLMTEEPIKECPKCFGVEIKRLFSPGAGFIFKGSGFYITDYSRSKEYKEAEKAEYTDRKPGKDKETKSDKKK
jgi:putative FmdB family regulatory protein